MLIIRKRNISISIINHIKGFCKTGWRNSHCEETDTRLGFHVLKGRLIAINLSYSVTTGCLKHISRAYLAVSYMSVVHDVLNPCENLKSHYRLASP